jgi:hypothetical protein
MLGLLAKINVFHSAAGEEFPFSQSLNQEILRTKVLRTWKGKFKRVL